VAICGDLKYWIVSESSGFSEVKCLQSAAGYFVDNWGHIEVVAFGEGHFFHFCAKSACEQICIAELIESLEMVESKSAYVLEWGDDLD
jgi:hypothetical protein